MSIFSQILDKLGLKKDKAATTSAPSAGTSPAAKPGPTGQTAAPAPSPAANRPSPSMPGARPGAVANPAASSPATPQAAEAARAATPAPMSEVDVVKKLETLSAGKGLNWKTSIVDLLKLLDIDSSREARTELAKELNAPADVMNDSARMNTWLHKEVLRRIAQNGGNIPKELLD
ncbi:MAG: DUF3597 domain-containing protein [Bacteroidota bacterium]